MPRPPKRISEFDVRLGEAIAHRRKHPDVALSQKALAEASGIALSNLQRREEGANEVTVSELERLAKALDTTPAELVSEALSRYGGIDRLIAEYTMSDTPDNVTGIRSKSTPGDGAQEELDEQRYAANFDPEHEQDEPDQT